VAGKIKKMIDYIVEERAKGNEIVRNTTRTKLVLKGFNPDKYTATSEDNPETIAELEKIAAGMGIKL
jgi:hypothetical protein